MFDSYTSFYHLVKLCVPDICLVVLLGCYFNNVSVMSVPLVGKPFVRGSIPSPHQFLFSTHQSLLRTSSKSIHDPHPASHLSLSLMRTCSLDDLASIIAPSQSLKKLFRPYHTSLSTYFTHRPDLLFRMDQSWRQITNYKRHSGAKQPSLGRNIAHQNIPRITRTWPHKVSTNPALILDSPAFDRA